MGIAIVKYTRRQTSQIGNRKWLGRNGRSTIDTRGIIGKQQQKGKMRMEGVSPQKRHASKA